MQGAGYLKTCGRRSRHSCTWSGSSGNAKEGDLKASKCESARDSSRALACAGAGGERTLTRGKSLVADEDVPDDGIRAGTLHPCPAATFRGK